MEKVPGTIISHSVLLFPYQAGYATYINIQHCLHHRLTFLKVPVLVSRGWCGLAVTVTQDKAG